MYVKEKTVNTGFGMTHGFRQALGVLARISHNKTGLLSYKNGNNCEKFVNREIKTN